MPSSGIVKESIKLSVPFMKRLNLTLLTALALTLNLPAQTTNIWLAWDHSTSTNVVGYKLSIGASPNTYSTNYLIQYTNQAEVTGLQYNRPYYFSMTAINDIGQESDFSNEVSWQYNIKPEPPTGLHITEAQEPPPTNAPNCTVARFGNSTAFTTGGDIILSRGFLAAPFLSDINYAACEVDLYLRRTVDVGGNLAVGISHGSMPSVPVLSDPVNMSVIPFGQTNWVTFQNKTSAAVGTNWVVLSDIDGSSGLMWHRNSAMQTLGTNTVNGVWRSADGINWTMVSGARRSMFKTRSQ